jgi:hypothetical protein
MSSTLIQGVTPAFTGGAMVTFTMDATTDFLAFRFLAFTTAPITKVEAWISTKTGTPGDMGVVIVAENGPIPNISGGVPVDIGGGSPTLFTVVAASTTTNSRHTWTFTNAFTPTAGTRYWIVFYPISGGTWDASNRYIFRQSFQGVGADLGDEVSASSTNTGTAFTRGGHCSHFSLLTTGDAYLPMGSSCCLDNSATVDWDDADNPDERGTAWTLPASTGAIVRGIKSMLRVSALTATFSIDAYVGDTSQGSRTIGTELADGTGNTIARLHFATAFTLTTAGTLRVAIKATHASDTIRQAVLEFGSQARRESCQDFKDIWYCHRNGGAGAFTDDKTRLYTILPVVEFYGTGGGGGTKPISTSMTGGLQ